MTPPEKRVVGFTGTRIGMTAKQLATLRGVLQLLRPTETHDGDALGADAEFLRLAIERDPETRTVAHPCDIEAARAFRPHGTTLEVRPPLDRNRDIVDACDILIAAPAGMAEERRSGTWATVRYARNLGRPIITVWPDGTRTRRGKLPEWLSAAN